MKQIELNELETEVMRQELILDQSGRPSKDEWVASGKSPLDYPTGFGKPLGELTGKDLDVMIKVAEAEYEANRMSARRLLNKKVLATRQRNSRRSPNKRG